MKSISDICTYFSFTVSFIILVSCNNQKSESIGKKRLTGRDIEGVNTFLVEKDRERIINYIERKSLVMNETLSGLWYSIKNEGSGRSIKEYEAVTMEFECYLLDGTKCYSSKETGPKTVMIGRSNIEPGLAEGLKLMKRGGEAIFIIPPFLAWGLHGDDNAIPPRAIIVYEVKILDNNGE